MSNKFKDWLIYRDRELSQALEETTYMLIQLTSDGYHQNKVKEFVEKNLEVLGETFEEFMEKIKQCRQ